MTEQTTKAKFANKEDLWEVITFLHINNHVIPSHVDIAGTTMHFKHHAPFDKEKYFKRFGKLLEPNDSEIEEGNMCMGFVAVH